MIVFKAHWRKLCDLNELSLKWLNRTRMLKLLTALNSKLQSRRDIMFHFPHWKNGTNLKRRKNNLWDYHRGQALLTHSLILRHSIVEWDAIWTRQMFLPLCYCVAQLFLLSLDKNIYTWYASENISLYLFIRNGSEVFLALSLPFGKAVIHIIEAEKKLNYNCYRRLCPLLAFTRLFLYSNRLRAFYITIATEYLESRW